MRIWSPIVNFIYRKENSMFKKCIATYLALLFVLMPFCTALAAGKKNRTFFNEQKLLNALIANAPFDVTAFKNVQADEQQLAAAAAKGAQQLLDLLNKHDKEFSLLVNTVCKRRVLNKPAEEIKFMILNGLQEMADETVTPGCLTPYTFSALLFFALTPITFVFFVQNLAYNTDEPNCAIAYGDWWLSFLFLSLAIRQTYNICTENSKEDPNETIIADYESDRTTMQILAFVFFGLGVYTFQDCPNSPFNVYGNRR
jgi:hypothetical protein